METGATWNVWRKLKTEHLEERRGSRHREQGVGENRGKARVEVAVSHIGSCHLGSRPSASYLRQMVKFCMVRLFLERRPSFLCIGYMTSAATEGSFSMYMAGTFTPLGKT
ncbi:hypothetical protein ABW19_dt0202104 [Dactylella cylindrospora]|nr:hypothetical protein ABW19_dt0202104 [Dactylella cylindrospora]